MAFLMRSFLWILMLAACSLTPSSGQFVCEDSEACPEGLTCISEVCVSDGSDAGNDTPDITFDESCSPSTSGSAVDEDLDGIIDEGCQWSFGTPHVPNRIQTTRVPFGAVFSGDGLHAYVATLGTGPLMVSERTSTASVEFGSAVPVGGTEPPTGFANVSASVDADVSTIAIYVTNVISSAVIILQRSGANYAELQRISGAEFPWLSANGRTLYITRGTLNDNHVFVLTRAELGVAFANERQLNLGGPAQAPTTTPDGLTLFYSRGTTLIAASRRSTEDDFGVGVELALDGYFRPVYLPASREMWLADQTLAEPRYVRRVQVCRDSLCLEDRVECGETGRRTPDGFTCFFASESEVAGDAENPCGDGASLAVITRPDELAALSALDVDGWIGLRRPPPDAEHAWLSGEPLLLRRWDSATRDGECVYSSDGSWHSSDCADTRVALCERTTFPTWLALEE